MAAYAREYDFYQMAARICSQKIESLLQARGIRAIVTYRAKRPSKLKLKLIQRNSQRKYKGSDEIRGDIADLAGARVALYFPADRERVKAIIHENFFVEQEKNFPESGKKKSGKRFDGYHADHYRITLLEKGMDEGDKMYCSARVEVQVGSVLMHAWAEVEHDLLYKPESGNLSGDENAILDELNGLVLSGEIALERLQRALERRLSDAEAPFDSHYELAAFLDRWARQLTAGMSMEIGRVDVLYELLKAAGKASPKSVGEILNGVEVFFHDDAISDQIIDVILSKDPGMYKEYSYIQSRIRHSDSIVGSKFSDGEMSDVIGRFLSKWIVLERTLTLWRRDERAPSGVRIEKIAVEASLSPDAASILKWTRSVRNQLVHGIEIPARQYLIDAADALTSVLNEISFSTVPGLSEAYKEASSFVSEKRR
ncbi:ppGpp synthetase/RelA/SpoT-type nucleotidyltransferase [Caulobacter sp. 1776]